MVISFFLHFLFLRVRPCSRVLSFLLTFPFELRHLLALAPPVVASALPVECADRCRKESEERSLRATRWPPVLQDSAAQVRGRGQRVPVFQQLRVLWLGWRE